MSQRTNAARFQKKGDNHSVELVSTADNNPLPPIDVLERLDKFRPDLVDFAIKQAVEESKDRRAKDDRLIEIANKERCRAQFLAFGICFLSIVGSCVLGWLGMGWAAATICGVPLTMIIATFLKH